MFCPFTLSSCDTDEITRSPSEALTRKKVTKEFDDHHNIAELGVFGLLV